MMFGGSGDMDGNKNISGGKMTQEEGMEKLEALASSSTMPALNFKALESLKLPFPYKEEQQKIANFLSSIDKSIENLGDQIEGSIVFKQGLLQKMFV